VALWGVFWLGDKFSQLLFDFARPQVDTIYGMKEGESPWLLTVLLLLLIGPAEEIFWRGYVQEAISKRWNANIGFVVTTLVYALVHAGSFNFMLLMAALVAGMAWGLLYRFFPERFTAIIISHALWDAAVFIWFPIM
jgi:membrane protease YdiL (CAAX protease family)